MLLRAPDAGTKITASLAVGRARTVTRRRARSLAARRTRVIAAVSPSCSPSDAAPRVRAGSAGVDDFDVRIARRRTTTSAATTRGYSTLRTVETFVGRLPDFDQNRGLVRAIPTFYGGVDRTTERVGP